MRTTDERMREVLSRARAREAASRRRRQRAVAIGGGTLSVAVVAVVGIGMASLAGRSGSAPSEATTGLMGSVLAGGPALGYVVAGLIGLVLGVAVTILAFRAGRKPPTGEPREQQGAEAPEDSGAGHGEGTP